MDVGATPAIGFSKVSAEVRANLLFAHKQREVAEGEIAPFHQRNREFCKVLAPYWSFPSWDPGRSINRKGKIC